MPRGGTPPLVPMWPGVRVIEQNAFPFFPFNPRWRERFTAPEFETFCALLRAAWISPRPCFLPPQICLLDEILKEYPRAVLPIGPRVLEQFETDRETGLLYFPPQLAALRRLVAGHDLYSLLWDANL